MAKTSALVYLLVITGVLVFIPLKTRQYVSVKTLHTDHTVKIKTRVPILEFQLTQLTWSTLEIVPVTLPPRFAWQATDRPLWSFSYANRIDIVEASSGCWSQRRPVVFHHL